MALSFLNILQTNLSRNTCYLPQRLSHKPDVVDFANRIDDHITRHILYACKYWATRVTDATFAPSDTCSQYTVTTERRASSSVSLSQPDTIPGRVVEPVLGIFQNILYQLELNLHEYVQKIN